jgi:hypothetical protein
VGNASQLGITSLLGNVSQLGNTSQKVNALQMGKPSQKNVGFHAPYLGRVPELKYNLSGKVYGFFVKYSPLPAPSPLVDDVIYEQPLRLCKNKTGNKLG